MPLDVPAYAFALPDGVDPPALVSFLAERFDLATDDRRPRSASRSSTRRTGACGRRTSSSDCSENAAAPRWSCTRRPGAAPVTAEAGRRSRWLADDLPPGALRDHLAPLIEMRALLPLARVQVELQPLQVRNADLKTVVRLRLATQAALDTDGDRVPLTPRLEVTGVLGYHRPLARVVTVLTTEAGLVEAPGSLADEAIAAAGGDPAGIRTKVRVALRPDQRTDKAALAVLRDLAGMVEVNLPGTLDDLDTEFLHDLRVAVRRSRSVLRELKGAFPPEQLEQQREALKWIQAITGPTRDLDVQLLDWGHLLSGVPAERHAALAPVRRCSAATGRRRCAPSSGSCAARPTARPGRRTGSS